jgi:hypothetical protein
MLSTRLAMNGARAGVIHAGVISLVFTVDRDVVYTLDGRVADPPYPVGSSACLAEDSGGVACVVNTGAAMLFVHAVTPGLWSAPFTLWSGPGEQPSLRVDPFTVTATWHADVPGAEKDANGRIYVARAYLDTPFAVVEIEGGGKFASVAPQADVVAFRRKLADGTWWIHTAELVDGKWVTTPVCEGMDPSVAVDAAGGTWIAYHRDSAIYLRGPLGNEIQLAKYGLFAHIAIDKDGAVLVSFELLASKGGGRSDSTKRRGIVRVRDGVPNDLSPVETGYVGTTLTPEGEVWAAVRSVDGSVVFGSVSG